MFCLFVLQCLCQIDSKKNIIQQKTFDLLYIFLYNLIVSKKLQYWKINKKWGIQA